ncbi:MAG: hypothetical protein AMXMBFR47_45690 [Planctomycetota bacterium]
MAAAIVHVTHESTTPGQRETILALVAASKQVGPQIVARAAGPAPWLVDVDARGRRRVALADLADGDTIVHYWCAPAALARRRVGFDNRACAAILLDVDSALSIRAHFPVTVAGIVVDSERARAAAVGHGAAPGDIAVIRPWVDYARIRRDDRARVRAQLGLTDGDRAALLLPPLCPELGTYESSWAALVVERVRPELKIIAPGGYPEASRLERLADAVDRTRSLLVASETLELPELLVASDVALLAPPADCPHRPIAWALAAGCPIVATATHATCELLAHEVNARLCRECAPRFIARRLLEALEAPDAGRNLVAHGRRQAYALFSRQRMIEQYARVYENARAGRTLADGIIDPLHQTTH